MKIHLIGICGSGMASLAGLLQKAGHQVSGSDTAFLPPMGDQLREMGVALKEGYHAKNLAQKPDVVVIGNVCTKDNPEAKAAMEAGFRYLSLPQALQEFFLKDKKSLIVAGTHGKTTTTNLLAWVLTEAGLDPGFFAGGIGKNFGASYHLGSGDYFVVEGDEYSTAFFDLGPKFAHYRPHGAILTSIELDHVDIFPSFAQVEEAFRKFCQTLAPASTLLAWSDSPAIGALTSRHDYILKGYGIGKGDYTAEGIKFSAAGAVFILCHGTERIPLTTTLFGNANLENTLAVCGLCHQLGLSWEQISKGLKTFQGVKKRQEIRGVVKDVTVIDDFAHHPTAVRRTIEALKARWPGERLTIVFEPRSNTSRRNVHYQEYCKAFKGASRVIIAPLYRPEKIPTADRLDINQLADDIMRNGTEAFAIENADAIIEFIVRSVGPKEVIAFFSNGDFGNIHQRLLEKLERRKIFPDKRQVRSIRVRT